MIGAIDQSCRQVTVVGAGASGLFAAYYLDRAGYEVTLIEEHQRVGGLISTVATPFGLIEGAANSMIATPQLRELAEAIGARLLPLNEGSRSKYIYRDGRLRKFPLSFIELIKLLYHIVIKKPVSQPKDMEAWATTYLGQAGFDYLIDPMVTGIYGTAASNLSVSAAFPRLQVEPGKRGLSLFGGKKSNGSNARGTIVSVDGGLDVFFQRLGMHLEKRLGERFKLNTKFTHNDLSRDSNLVLCVPAHAAAKLMVDQEPSLSDALKRVEYTPMISVGVFASKQQLNTVPNGLGVLIPSKAGLETLGVLFSSSSFEGKTYSSEQVLLTVLIGGSRNPKLIEQSDRVIADIVLKDLERFFGLSGEPLHIEISRWPKAIPVYSSQLEEVWQLAGSSWCAKPGQVLFGNYTGQVSLRGMLNLASSIAE